MRLVFRGYDFFVVFILFCFKRNILCEGVWGLVEVVFNIDSGKGDDR